MLEKLMRKKTVVSDSSLSDRIANVKSRTNTCSCSNHHGWERQMGKTAKFTKNRRPS